MLDSTRAAKSLEERQQQYEEVRSRIFTGEEQMEVSGILYCDCKSLVAQHYHVMEGLVLLLVYIDGSTRVCLATGLSN